MILMRELNISIKMQDDELHKHVNDWEGVKVIDRENNTALRKLRESVAIAKEKRVMNRDERGYQLSPIYRPLFTAGNHSSSKPAL
ncbi:hypothetical protein DPMN_039059 [Dreissena polymorpha]|uniref:Uncharacterized protein n=1 Tax=Dreissena polymorpha TaxID=45954 RepID=A0A9D4MDX6_DREPO|nr:hypothetical protein DPMN_039059 [Dreissena polymorpha]